MSSFGDLPSTLSLQDEWVAAVTEGCSVVRVVAQPATKPGENFVSKVTKVTLYCRNPNNEETAVSVIVKEMHPDDSPQCQIMDCRAMFDNEVRAYQKILPALFLAKIETPASLPRELTPDILKVYHSPGKISEGSSDEPLHPLEPEPSAIEETFPILRIAPRLFHATTNCLVLEDLQRFGFKTCDRKKGLGVEECRLALDAIAYLHAQSLVLKSKNRQQWEWCCSQTQETVFCERFTGQTIEVIWDNSLWTALRSLRTSLEPELEGMAGILESIRGQVLMTLRQLSSKRDEFSVICHGDLWCNNLVFRYNEENTPAEVRLLDFQAMRQASCALDILHLLCTSTYPGLLEKQFHPLLQHYHSCLARHLPARTPPPFSQEELYNEMKRNIFFGLLLGFMMIPCATSDPVPEDLEVPLEKEGLSSQENLLKNYETLGEFCHVRVRTLVKDLLSLGLLHVDSDLNFPSS